MRARETNGLRWCSLTNKTLFCLLTKMDLSLLLLPVPRKSLLKSINHLLTVSILQKPVMIYGANRLDGFHMITRLFLNKFNNETHFGWFGTKTNFSWNLIFPLRDKNFVKKVIVFSKVVAVMQCYCLDKNWLEIRLWVIFSRFCSNYITFMIKEIQ